jgi:hypothetical protein
MCINGQLVSNRNYYTAPPQLTRYNHTTPHHSTLLSPRGMGDRYDYNECQENALHEIVRRRTKTHHSGCLELYYWDSSQVFLQVHQVHEGYGLRLQSTYVTSGGIAEDLITSNLISLQCRHRSSTPQYVISYRIAAFLSYHRSHGYECTVLYCTVLYCTVLYCTVLYCTVLYCTALYCTVLYCTALYCTALYCTVLSYVFVERGK